LFARCLSESACALKRALWRPSRPVGIRDRGVRKLPTAAQRAEQVRLCGRQCTPCVDHLRLRRELGALGADQLDTTFFATVEAQLRQTRRLRQR
jgi:hypothetical protein